MDSTCRTGTSDIKVLLDEFKFELLLARRPSNPVIPPKPLHKPRHAFLHSDLWSHTKVAH